MTTRAMGPLAGIGWLKNGINLGRNNPKAVFGGAGLLLLLALLPTLVTFPIQLALTPGPAGQMGIMALSLLASVLLVPLMGSYLGLIHAVEQGRPARATDIFDAYRGGGGALRLIGFGVAMLLVYVVAMVVIVAVAGTGIFSWYMQALATSQGGGDPAALQQLPNGFGLAVALGSVMWLFVSGMYSIGFGQVAIARRGVAGALGDGAVGAVKNVLPILVLTLAGIVASLVLGVMLLLLGLLVGFLAKLVGVWLLVVIAVPAYIALLLAVYVVMFGVIYHLWRDVCGGDEMTDAPADALTA